jgi:predicted site-specific integrase-resolvase
MKLSEYARKMGVRYETAWRWFRQGDLPGQQLPSGTIVVFLPEERRETHQPVSVAVYARVSAAENRPDLERQADRLMAYCSAKGYQITQVVKEVGSGVNDGRPRFLRLLADSSISVIVVEHKDRAACFGFRYLETLLERQGRRIEVVNLSEDGREDLVSDLVAIVSSFSARMYGQRRAKRKTEAIIKELTDGGDTDATSRTAPH